MTFTNFLQVLAFNLLSNTIPFCIFAFITTYAIVKMYEKRIYDFHSKLFNLGQQPTKRRKTNVDNDED